MDGTFVLKINDTFSLNSKGSFSHLNFENREVSFEQLNEKGEVKLTPNMNNLDEVVAISKKPKTKRLGRKSKGFGLMQHNFYTADEKDVDDRLSKEMGVRPKIRRNCRINKFF